jgi:hypothetical protein
VHDLKTPSSPTTVSSGTSNNTKKRLTANTNASKRK